MLERVLEGGSFHLGLALLEQALNQLAHLIGALAHHGTLLGGELAHHAHEAGHATFAAEQGHAGGLELLGVVGVGDKLLCLRFELGQIIDQTHLSSFPVCTGPMPRPPALGNKKPSLGASRLPKDG